jgi:hypothetical protein
MTEPMARHLISVSLKKHRRQSVFLSSRKEYIPLFDGGVEVDMKRNIYRNAGRFFLCAALALVLALALSACGGGGGAQSEAPAGAPAGEPAETPSEVVADVLDTLKKQDPAAWVNPSGGGADYLSEAIGMVSGKVTDFEWTVTGEQVNGSTAQVTVELKTYGFGTAFERAMNECLTQVATRVVEEDNAKKESEAKEEDEFEQDVLSGIGDAEARTIFAEKFSARLAQIQKDFSYQATLSVSQNADGGWVLGRASEDFIDALYGGMITEAGSIDAAYADRIFGEVYAKLAQKDA